MEHHNHNHSNHNSAKDFLRRFWIVTFLLTPLIFAHRVPFGKWLGFGIATIIFSFSLVFFQHAWHEIKARKYGMMTLVSLAVGSGYLFSVASTFIQALDVEFYIEISTLIWVLLFGHYLEARSSSAAGDTLQEVAKLLPKKAHLLESGVEKDVDIAELKEKDTVLVKVGEKIPADGIIKEGSANIDESLVSGESKPIEKKAGDGVVAGSICLDGSLTITLSRVGEHSMIGQIKKLIAEAQNTKPRSQRIADRASAVLIFIAGITALATILVWTLIIGETFVFAITLAITVLVIACPHALGLAIPIVTTITTSLAVKNGIFIKNLAKIETIKKTDYVVFDKTGTLTLGAFGVSDAVSFGEMPEKKIVSIIASLEQHSSHIIGQSIVKYAKENKINLSEPKQFKNVSGKGVMGYIDNELVYVGNHSFIKEHSSVSGEREFEIDKLLSQGKTLVLVANKDKVLGAISLSDEIKQESFEAVKKLHSMGIKVAMLTGDNKQVADTVANQLGIDTYFAEVLPEDKYTYVKKLQEDGVVIMIGDGVNDAPALTQADAGIAIGAGTDVAVEAGDIVLTRNNPLDVVRLLKLSRAVYSKMMQNLVWALGYNVIAIPTAAGVFAVWGFFLRPGVGAILMSLSSVIVVINAMMLKKINLDTI